MVKDQVCLKQVSLPWIATAVADSKQMLQMAGKLVILKKPRQPKHLSLTEIPSFPKGDENIDSKSKSISLSQNTLKTTMCDLRYPWYFLSNSIGTSFYYTLSQDDVTMVSQSLESIIALYDFILSNIYFFHSVFPRYVESFSKSIKVFNARVLTISHSSVGRSATPAPLSVPPLLWRMWPRYEWL